MCVFRRFAKLKMRSTVLFLNWILVEYRESINMIALKFIFMITNILRVGLYVKAHKIVNKRKWFGVFN